MSAGQAAGWAILAVMLLLAVVGTARWLYDSTEPYGTHCAPAPARRTGRLAGLRSRFLGWLPLLLGALARWAGELDDDELDERDDEDDDDLPAREVDCGRAARRTPGRLESGPATGAAPDFARSGAVPLIAQFEGRLSEEEAAEFRAAWDAVTGGSAGHRGDPLPRLRMCCATTEYEDHAHRCEASRVYPPPAPETHPYPPPTMYPRTSGDGLIVLGPDGCELVPRPQFGRHAAETSCDLAALPVVPRYLDAMPGGTE